MTTLTADSMLDEAWTLSESVALRPEPFGALAYHFGNRKLTFLKKTELVEVVNVLGECATVSEALAHCDIPRAHWGAYARALHGLAASDMIMKREPA